MSLAGRMVKGRKSLSDITNTSYQQRGAKSVADQENRNSVAGTSTKVYIAYQAEDNTSLVRLLEERDQTIEPSGQELRKLRLALQKAYQQNWQLAHTNSQMLAELNTGRKKLYDLQHKFECTTALLKVTNSELKEKNLQLREREKQIKLLNEKIDTKERTIECSEVAGGSINQVNKPCYGISNKERTTKCTEVAGDTTSLAIKEPSNLKRKRTLRSDSSGFSISTHEVAGKEKDYNRRKSLRRQSRSNESELHKPIEDFFEMDDINFPVPPPLKDPTNEDLPVQKALLSVAFSSTSTKPENEGEHKDTGVSPEHQNLKVERISIGRPLRRSTIGVSYKERNLRDKMRRSCQSPSV